MIEFPDLHQDEINAKRILNVLNSNKLEQIKELVVVQLNQLLEYESLVLSLIAQKKSQNDTEFRNEKPRISKYMKEMKEIYCMDYLNTQHLGFRLEFKKEALVA